MDTGQRPLRVLVADDQTAVREGLVTLLETFPDMEVVGAAANGDAVLEMVAADPPDVVLMDLRMPGRDGVSTTAQLRADYPSVNVVVLTTYADDSSVRDALRAGALGFLTKDAGRADIARALAAAASGQSVMDAEVQRRLLAGISEAPSPVESHEVLSGREIEVLRLIATGLSNREIAGTLFIGEATVKSHINRIFAKIGVRDRAQAVRYAFQHGLTGEPRG
ncbi:DNA-binding response regulator [Kibdelosporangium aridum]|uniref:DNA-binding response regulator n=1 Tax=Kibdelosporangium aridum TaxID=2030 RepID=A0A428YBQ4_KIBAR|nr:response regulator transcription factor [Kibdelosporangium aridum]RSM65025.1 DNA-binding response regulator [Kibdelosporangium aridum]